MDVDPRTGPRDRRRLIPRDGGRRHTDPPKGTAMRPIRDRIDTARQLEYVTVQDFSLLSGISERTIWRRIKAGLFPHVLKNGRITRIHRALAMKALHAQQEIQP